MGLTINLHKTSEETEHIIFLYNFYLISFMAFDVPGTKSKENQRHLLKSKYTDAQARNAHDS